MVASYRPEEPPYRPEEHSYRTEEYLNRTDELSHRPQAELQWADEWGHGWADESTWTDETQLLDLHQPRRHIRSHRRDEPGRRAAFRFATAVVVAAAGVGLALNLTDRGGATPPVALAPDSGFERPHTLPEPAGSLLEVPLSPLPSASAQPSPSPSPSMPAPTATSTGPAVVADRA